MSAGPARRERTAAEVLAQFEAGDPRGLARALSWVEDGDPRGREVLAAVYPRTGRARVVGITGSPGAGKSTLVDHVAARLVREGRRVAILAVDPSSAFSGGAVLGDRIRMREAASLPGVFIRSVATRGHLGGLSRATEDALDLLDAFGFDLVLLETVGVGQDEVEVIQVAPVCVVVLVPFMGDDVQAIKAGIMEIADAYVINKSDREGADRMEAHLRATLQLYDDAPRDVPILRTVATRGEGVPELVLCLESLARARQQDGGRWRRTRVARRVAGLLRDRLHARFLEGHGQRAAVEEVVGRVADRALDPHAAVELLLGAGAPRLDHLGIAVADAAGAAAFWREALGLPDRGAERVESERVSVALLAAGEARVELLEPLPGDGPIASFLAKRGPGIHHACFEVPDIEATLARLRAAGVRLVGDAPRRGAGGRLVAFVHPGSAHGVLVEISQPAPHAEAPS